VVWQADVVPLFLGKEPNMYNTF